MPRLEIKKMDSLTRLPGCEVWSTDQSDLAVMEWDSEAAGRLALSLQTLLSRHAVKTNGLNSFGLASLLVIRIEPLEFTAVVRASAGETAVSFVVPDGEDALPAIKPERLSALEDTAVQAARSLRAHLAPVGVHDLRLHLRFGIGPDNETLLQVINPVECDFGIADHQVLLTQLGGDPT